MADGLFDDQSVAASTTLRPTQGMFDDQSAPVPQNPPLHPDAVSEIQSRVKDASQPKEGAEGQPRQASSFEDTIEAAYEQSVSGLFQRGKLPSVVMPEHADLLHKLLFDTVGLVGDAPAIGTGALGGGAAGAAVGTVELPVVGTIGLGLAGAGAGAFGLPTYLRTAYMDWLKQGGTDPKDFLTRVSSSFLGKHALVETGKAGLVGGLTAATGGATSELLAAKEVGGAAAATISTQTAAATMTTLNAAIHGQMPTVQDFAENAILGGALQKGFEALPAKQQSAVNGRVETWLKDNYTKTGEHPAEAAKRMVNDPELRQTAYTHGLGDGGYKIDAYHGTAAAFDDFASEYSGTNTKAAPAGKAFFFSDNAKTASGYAEDAAKEADTEEGANVRPAKLKLDNPLTVDFQQQFGGGAKMDFYLKQAKAEGRDGVIFKNIRDSATAEGNKVPGTVYAVFDPANIKSKFEAQFQPPKEPPAEGTPFSRILSKVKDVEPAKQPATFDDWMFDYAQPLQHAISQATKAQKASGGDAFPRFENPGELLSAAYGARGHAENLITSVWKPALDPIMKAGKFHDFVAYATALRANDIHAKGLESGFDPKDVSAVVREGNKDPQFKAAAKATQDLLDRVRSLEVQTGMLSQDRVDAMKDMDANYMPWHRIIGQEAPKGGMKAGGRGFPVFSTVKKMTGSKADIANPFTNLRDSVMTRTQVAFNNNALSQFRDFSEELPAEHQLMAKNAKAISITALSQNDKALSDFLDTHGIDPSEANGLMVYRAVQKTLDDNQVLIYNDGKPEVWTAKDPKLVSSLRNLDPMTMGAGLGLARKFAAVFRSGIVLDPAFQTYQIFRTEIVGAIQRPGMAVPFWDTFTKGFGSLLAKDDMYQRWLEAGGGHAFLTSMDHDLFQKDYFSLEEKKTLPGNAWNLLSTAAHWSHVITETHQAAAGLAEFKRAVGEGKSDLVAAVRSRNALMDHMLVGNKMRAINAIGTFPGPTINHIRQLATALKEDPVGTMTKGALFITAPTMMLWMANQDKKWYKDVPQLDKDRYFLFDFGDRDNNPDAPILKLPKQYGFGFLFGAVPERLFTAWHEQDPEEATKQLGMSFAKEFAPWQTLVPAPLKPLAEVATNTRFDSEDMEQPIVPHSLERVLPEYRYTPYTSEVAKTLGKLMPDFVPDRFKAPAALDHLMNGWGGTLGTYAVRAVDLALKKEDKSMPTRGLEDVPFVKSFVLRTQGRSEAVDEFYKAAKEQLEVIDTYKNLVRQGDGDEAQALLQSKGVPVQLTKIEAAMSQMRKVIQGVNALDDMTPDDKRRIIDNAYGSMVPLAQEGLKLVRKK